MNKKFYITTAIDYVNASPHMGHALEKIQADVIARYHRSLGEEVFFLTGVDENSLKNVQAADREGISVKDLVDRNTDKFYQLKKLLNLSFNDFIRTTEDRHINGAKKLWSACQKDIYKKNYQGLYCVGCEEFYKEKELENGFCLEHKAKPEFIKEENYFFKLSKYQNKLKEIIKKDEVQIIPETRKNEVLSFIESGLEDICISRSSERAKGWGIEVPGDPTQVQWVWIDALTNYINAVGYGDDDKKFKKWWPADIHVIGKGILRFHAIYWLAFLLSAKISLPKKIFVHGYITVDSQKMSKSLGNVINPFDLVKKHTTDSVRYFLLKEIPSTKDGDFTYKKFENRYNADLAGGIGNLVSRVRAMAEKKEILNCEQISNSNLQIELDKTRKIWKDSLDEFKFNECLNSIWKLISFCDKYIEKERPWEKPDKKQTVIISDLLLVINSIAEFLKPFLPETSEKILSKEKKILFPKID